MNSISDLPVRVPVCKKGLCACCYSYINKEEPTRGVNSISISFYRYRCDEIYGRCRRSLRTRSLVLTKLVLFFSFSRAKEFSSPPPANKSGSSLRIENTELRPMSLPARLNMFEYNWLSRASSATAEGLASRTARIPHCQEDPSASTML